jgi:hypothetical protein
MRLVFGPRISGLLPRPEVAGELPDVTPVPTVKEARAGVNPGQIDVDVAFQFEPYDPSAMNAVQEVHAIHYGKGEGIPTDAKIAIAGSQPKASSVPPDMSAGGEHVVTIEAAPAGFSSIVTVFGYPDAPTPTPSATSTSNSTSSATSDPSTVPADPTDVAPVASPDPSTAPTAS